MISFHKPHTPSEASNSIAHWLRGSAAAGLFAMSALVPQVHADASTNPGDLRLSAGVGIGFYDDGLTVGPRLTKADNFAWQAGVGLGIAPDWLVEARYVYQGEAKVKRLGTVEFETWALNIQWSLPGLSHESWSVYVLGGMDFPSAKTSGDLNLKGRDDLGWVGGLGAHYHADKWSFSTEVATYSAEITTWMFSINRSLEY